MESLSSSMTQCYSHQKNQVKTTGLLTESTDKYDNLKRIAYEIYAF